MASHIISTVSKDAASAAGLKRYFIGAPCGNGHRAERYVKDDRCVECIRLKNAVQRAKRVDYFREYNANRYKQKSEEIKQYLSQWRRDNPERYAAARKKYRLKNPSKLVESAIRHQKKKYAESPEFRCIKSLRVRFLSALKAEMITKKGSYSQSLGYSGSELVAHLERQFVKGMSWDNHGEWHIDHITPVSVLVRQGITDPSVVNCLSNLRPMWAKDNIAKGAKRTLLL